jgi:hypothetical protein
MEGGEIQGSEAIGPRGMGENVCAKRITSHAAKGENLV